MLYWCESVWLCSSACVQVRGGGGGGGRGRGGLGGGWGGVGQGEGEGEWGSDLAWTGSGRPCPAGSSWSSRLPSRSPRRPGYAAPGSAAGAPTVKRSSKRSLPAGRPTPPSFTSGPSLNYEDVIFFLNPQSFVNLWTINFPVGPLRLYSWWSHWPHTQRTAGAPQRRQHSATNRAKWPISQQQSDRENIQHKY